MTEPINPFHLHDSPRKQPPLCPWEDETHFHYYVDVDNAEQAFGDFVEAMGDLTRFLDRGQLVLVTGDSGCGKTALVNKCAHWMVQELGCARRVEKLGFEPTAEVIDLTRCLAGRPQLPVEDRLSAVCDVLFGELWDRDALRPGAAEHLGPERERPDRIYPRMPNALVDGRVLIILLPTPYDLGNEVIRYGSLVRGRVLFLVESALLDEDDAGDIRRALRDGIPPITLSVGILRPGDVRRFVSDRLGRHSGRGIYPRMAEETMDSVASLLRSVAQLQDVLSKSYDARRDSGLPYGEDCYVTADEVRQQFRSGRGGVR